MLTLRKQHMQMPAQALNALLGNLFCRSERSLDYWERARRTIMNGTHTYGRSADQGINNGLPIFIDKARDSRLWDVDGSEYVDLTAGLGSILLGYNYTPIMRAVREQLAQATFVGITHRMEVELAEAIREVVPSAQMVRFFKSGAEAVSAAVRIARAFTRRHFIVKLSYHGWHDWSMAASRRNAGIPPSLERYVATAFYNDFASVERLCGIHRKETAAIIMEPVTFDPPRDNFLQQVRQLCTDLGIMLIYDEVLTGGRFAAGGAQEYFQCIPDLCVFSKSIANGMPLSFLAGQASILEEVASKVFISSTFSGELLSLATLGEVLKILKQEGTIANLWEKGERLQYIFNTAFDGEPNLRGRVRLTGYPPRLRFRFEKIDQKIVNKLIPFMLLFARANGILLNQNIFPMLSHTESDFAKISALAFELAPLMSRFASGAPWPPLLEDMMFAPIQGG